jgi:hypothetical protein
MSGSGSGSGLAAYETAETLLGRLRELSTDLRAAAIFGAGGEQLAASDGAIDWGERAAALWAAADGSATASPDAVHVGTEEGEVFAVRTAAASIVATSERFALASLMFCDLRALLRDLEAELGS